MQPWYWVAVGGTRAAGFAKRKSKGGLSREGSGESWVRQRPERRTAKSDEADRVGWAGRDGEHGGWWLR